MIQKLYLILFIFLFGYFYSHIEFPFDRIAEVDDTNNTINLSTIHSQPIKRFSTGQTSQQYVVKPSGLSYNNITSEQNQPDNMSMYASKLQPDFSVLDSVQNLQEPYLLFEGQINYFIGDYDIWMISAHGGTAVKVTGHPSEGDYDPAVSKSGLFVSYARYTAPSLSKQNTRQDEKTNTPVTTAVHKVKKMKLLR